MKSPLENIIKQLKNSTIFLTVLNSDNGKYIVKRWNYTAFKNKTNNHILEWFLNLETNNITIKKERLNGKNSVGNTSYKTVGIVQINLDQVRNQPTTTNTVTYDNIGLNGLNGLSQPQLIANTMFLQKIEQENRELKALVTRLTDKLGKVKSKLQDVKNDLLVSDVENNSKPAISPDITKELIATLPQLLGALRGGNGLNAAENTTQTQLSTTQTQFIEVVKELDDQTLTKLYTITTGLKNANINKEFNTQLQAILTQHNLI